VVAAPAARQFQTVDVDLLNISLDADWAPTAAPGYFPARFEVSNAGDERAIEIVGEGTRTYMGPRALAGAGSTFVRQSVRLGAGDRVRLTIPVPIYGDTENIRFEIRERGRVIYRFSYVGMQSRAAAADASALVVATPGSVLSRITLRTAPMTRARTVSGRRGSTSTIVIRPSGPARPGVFGGALDFQLEPSRLPANWLGYTSLRAVVLGPVEWEELTDGQKSALLAWTASGGDLVFVDGDIRSLLPAAQVQAAADPERATARHLFGRVHAVPPASVETGLTALLTATESDRDLNWALPANAAPDWGAVEKGGFRLRIPGVDGVPARAYLGILLLFAVVIGPLNYWLLRRQGRQVLVVLTAPLISATFIVVLAAYAVAGQGFRVLGRAVTVTMIDQVTKQAVTRATASLYAPGLIQSGGLRFGRDSAVWAVGPEGSGTRDRLELDLTDAQHFSSGVLQTRSPTNFEQVTFRTARERLTFGAADGGLAVTNGLDATILALFYREGGTVHSLDGPLSPGGRQTMRAGAFDSRRVLPDGVAIPGRLVNLLQQQPTGSYLAVLEQSPFWEPGVPRVSERGSVHLVLGWPEGQQ
jgi:hypothetical protein